MNIISHINELHEWRQCCDSVALVPTMGNLHDGHLKLVSLARQHANHVVVSIFVNPLQFGPNEDFHRYPRTFEQDASKLRECGVDLLFAPNTDALFPHPQRCHIELPSIADQLCGSSRPGHFRGVATIVMKLFNLVQPQVACFGKKDYQQLTIIRMMAEDFAVPVRIEAGETVRALDGLALSSRNQYLSESERKMAPELFQQLQRIAHNAHRHADFPALEQAAMQALNTRGWQTDYISIRTRQLEIPSQHDTQLVVLGAAKLGNTRLIDNLEFIRPRD